MRLALAILVLVFTSNIYSQVITERGRFELPDGDRIEKVELLDAENRLLLIGRKNVRVWDVGKKELLGSAALENDDQIDFAALAPDRQRVLSASRVVKAVPKKFAPAAVFDLKSGKKVFSFDQKIAAGFWSANGRTLVTTDKSDEQLGRYFGVKAELSIRDGENFRLRRSIAFEKFFAAFFSPDGERLFVHSKDKKGIEKIETYSALTGALENTLIASTDRLQFKDVPYLSRSGRFLGLIVTAQTAGKERTLLVWETNGNAKPVYEIKTAPNISASEFIFSRDEKFVAVDTKKTVQIYELATAKQVGEVVNTSLPKYWIADNRIFFYGRALGVAVQNSTPAYQIDAIYRTELYDETSSSQQSRGVPPRQSVRILDQSFVIPAPNDKYLLSYSNNLLKIYNSTDGKLLGTLIEPPPKNPTGVFQKTAAKSDQKPDSQNTRVLIGKSNWSENGNLIYAVDRDYETVSVWEIK